MNMRAIADDIVASLPAALSRGLSGIDHGIWSVFLCGSYVRGDFIPGNSDLDFVVVFLPGRGYGEFPRYEGGCDEGLVAVHSILRVLLNGREFHGHHPNDFDVTPILCEWIPTTSEAVFLPDGTANFRYLNLFLFDLREHLRVLWGTDPRTILPSTYPFHTLVRKWFQQSQTVYKAFLANGDAARCAFRAFISLQIAQIVFGERTVDKRNLLELYTRNIPDWSMKDFGIHMIREKMDQRFPDHPPRFAPVEQYAVFDEQLGELVCEKLDSLKKE